MSEAYSAAELTDDDKQTDLVESWTALPEVDVVAGTNRRAVASFNNHLPSITQHLTASLNRFSPTQDLTNPFKPQTSSKMKTSAIFSILALAAAAIASPLAVDSEGVDSK